MHRSTNVLGGLCLALALTACGGGYSGFIIPQETPIKPWVVHDESEILEQAGIESAMDDDTDDGEDFEDYEDYEDGEEADEAEAPAPAPAAPTAPTTKPAPKAKQ